MEYFRTFLEQVLFLTQQMSVYLLLGFLVAGLLHVFVKREWIHAQLGANSKLAVVKAVFLGAPLPLCSCGVIPVAASLKKAGASPAAILAFLIATPVTGVDSMLATYALMGTFIAIVRPAASIVIALGAGFILLAVTVSTGESQESPTSQPTAGAGISLPRKLLKAVRYGLDELLSGIARPVVVGLLVGGAIATFVPAHFINHYVGSGPLAYAAMVLLATPLYVCATGSIPIAAALMAKGLSPGAALAFLLAGPATNTVTIAVAKDIIGKKGTVVYLVVLMAGTFALAAGTDWLATVLQVDTGAALAQHHHAEGTSLLFRVAGWLTLGLLAWHLVSPHARRLLDSYRERQSMTASGAQAVMRVPDATCKNCTGKITDALGKLDYVNHVSVDLSSKLVKVMLAGDEPEGGLKQALKSAGYDSERIS